MLVMYSKYEDSYSVVKGGFTLHFGFADQIKTSSATVWNSMPQTAGLVIQPSCLKSVSR